MRDTDFEKHVFLTYHYLRITMAIVCGLLAIGLVVLGGWLGVGLQPTLSNYYYAEVPPAYARAAFVGLLAVLGALLIAYRGYTTVDDWIHNGAGFLALGVACFPMVCPYKAGDANFHLCVSTPWRGLHYLCAISVFVTAIASIIYGGGACFRKIASPSALQRFDKLRAMCGLVIGIGVLVPSYLLAFVAEASWSSWVIFSEASAFAGFGAYWAALTWCVAQTNSERKAKRDDHGRRGAAVRSMREVEEGVAGAQLDAPALGEADEGMVDIP